MPLVTLFFVLVFGGLTLWLQDDLFIKMKPTIVNCIFGTALLGGLLFGKSLLAYVFDAAFKLDEEGWRKLTLRFGLLFLRAGPAQRDRLAQFLDRFLGRLQDLGRHAADNDLHDDAAFAYPAAHPAGSGGRQAG